MVKARDVNKDIRAIAQKVKTAVFSYDEVHNENVQNEFHYDYELVIQKVSELNDWDRKESLEHLLGTGVLSPLPNGEYKVNVGTSTKNGGGANYHGLAFFSLNSEDYSTKYHELAHSLQRQYNLFNEEKIDKLYRTSAQGMDESDTQDKQINKIDYKAYLKEMHSESFSYAALMLRAENPWDFARQVYNAYNNARLSTATGFFSFGKTEYGGDNNNTKFYSTFPVMKETIKAVMKIRKQKKTHEFFDENGVLNDEKLAKLCEQAVIKNAYSPRTLNSYFKYRFFDGHNDNEHGWRRDALKGVSSFLQGSVMYFVSEGGYFEKVKSIRKHRIMEHEEKAKISQMEEPRIFKDAETQALHDYIRFVAKCSEVASKYKGEMFDSGTLVAQSLSVLRYEDKPIHEPSIRDQARLLVNNMSSKKQEALGNEMVDLRYWVRDHKDNPYFCHLVAENTELSEIIRMYNEKLKNPEKRQIESPTPIKTFSKKENPRYATYSVRTNMHHIDDFTQKFNCSDTFKQALVNLSLQDVSVIDDENIRNSLADSVQFKMDVFGIRKRKFKKELNKTLDSIATNVFYQRNNLSYEGYKKQFEGMSLEAILEKTKEHTEARRKEEKKASPSDENSKNSENRELALSMLNNNLEAMNYLADRYGISDKLRIQLQKMAVLPQDKLENKQLRKALAGVIHFDGDWFGSEKRQFKKDLDKLMDGFIEDRIFQKDNPAYDVVCQEAAKCLMEGKPLPSQNNDVKETVTTEVKSNAAMKVEEMPIAEVKATEQPKVKNQKKEEVSMNNTVSIFGKEYPLYKHYHTHKDGHKEITVDKNNTPFSAYLPDFFAAQKHFSPDAYQAEVARKFPKFKTKWYQKAPSEKEIEKYLIEQYSYAAMDGATGVPMVEEKLGIKIGGGYKYPKGMSDIEYHAYTMGQIGLYTPFREPNPENQKEAYMEAWQELHYPREKILPILQQQYHELVELNPQLKDIQLDTNNPVHLTLFRFGVTYDFPVADINLFIAEHDKGEIAARHRERMKKELDAIGLNEADFAWVLSSETIKNIGEKLQEKDKISAKETETPKVIEEKPTEQPKVEELPKTEEKPIAEPEKPKTPKEIVAEKLKAWGVEEGSYMIITPEDNLYTRYDGAEGPTARSVEGYFEDGIKDVAETGKEVVYGTNNGLCGAYFAEGVYVVSANTALRDALHYKGADVGFGVMLSNGEPFVKADASRDSETNADWANIRRVGEKISDERAAAYEARQKMMEEQRNATAADNVSQTLVRLCELGDKYDTSGGLKENLALAYVSAPEQMTGVEFWGKIVQQYGDTAPEGRDKMVLEITQLGADVTKEIKGNEKNHSYTAVKKRCAESQNSDDMLKTAKACSARSHSNASQYREAAYKS